MKLLTVLNTNDRLRLISLLIICGLAAAALSGCRMPAADQGQDPVVEQQAGTPAADTAGAAQDQDPVPSPIQPEVEVTSEVLPTETPVPTEDNGLDATYQDPEVGFSFDYPDEWERGYEERGVRGGFFTFIDPEGSPAEILVQVTIYRWDPTRDLEAFQKQRRTAWESSQSEILKEEDWTWGEGIPGKTFRLESREEEIVDIYLTYTGDYYLEFTTTSEFDTLALMVSTLR